MVNEDSELGQSIEIDDSGHLAVPEVDDVQKHKHSLLVAIVDDYAVIAGALAFAARSISSNEHFGEDRRCHLQMLRGYQILNASSRYLDRKILKRSK